MHQFNFCCQKYRLFFLISIQNKIFACIYLRGKFICNDNHCRILPIESCWEVWEYFKELLRKMWQQYYGSWYLVSSSGQTVGQLFFSLTFVAYVPQKISAMFIFIVKGTNFFVSTLKMFDKFLGIQKAPGQYPRKKKKSSFLQPTDFCVFFHIICIHGPAGKK